MHEDMQTYAENKFAVRRAGIPGVILAKTSVLAVP
jgi:hypothetical protein